MMISTLIEVELSDETEHHSECEREHLLTDVVYTVTTESGGKSVARTRCCMLYEMEDAAHDAIEEAYELSDYGNLFGLDWDIVRDAAAKLAARADGVGVAQNARLHQEVS